MQANIIYIFDQGKRLDSVNEVIYEPKWEKIEMG